MFSVPEQGGDLACLAKGGEDERTTEKSLDVRQGQAPCGQEDTLSEITGRSYQGENLTPTDLTSTTLESFNTIRFSRVRSPDLVSRRFHVH